MAKSMAEMAGALPGIINKIHETPLPIDVILNTNPPQFKWLQKIPTPYGPRIVRHTGNLPLTVENAVALLIEIAKNQAVEITDLRRNLVTAMDRIVTQAELLEKRAEKPIPQPIPQPAQQPPGKKGK